LESESGEVVEQAIAITGSFRVKEVLPSLLQMLKKKSISGADLHEKIPIIRALGQIGDPGALNALRDVLSSKSFLFKGAVEKLKEEVYMALRSYPYEDIKDLIEAGLRSRNEQIRGESRKIRRQHGG
jgi:HEAT repeat protein